MITVLLNMLFIGFVIGYIVGDWQGFKMGRKIERLKCDIERLEEKD